MVTLQRAARGETQADLAVVRCQLVNVATHQIYPVEVYVKNGVIVYVESDKNAFCELKANAAKVYDAGGSFLLPGLLDSHLHVESSMLTPYNFGCGVAVHGTTCVFTDCHELVNVAGKEAFVYMLEDGKRSPIRQLMLVPSCVPSVPGLENAGASITANDVREMARLDPERVVGLAEVMNYPQVIGGEKLMRDILQAARESGLYLQSHYYELFGRNLAAYLIHDLGGNHELRTAKEVDEVLRQGGWVDLRGGSSISANFKELLESVKRFPHPTSLRVTVCTDDRHAKDILDGHINLVVARMVAEGVAPTVAIACATRNIAQEYDIANLGEVAVGKLADMIVVPRLEDMRPTAVFVGGSLVAENRVLLTKGEPSVPKLRHSVKLKPIKPEDLLIAAPKVETSGNGANKTVKINAIDFTAKITTLAPTELPVDREGHLALPPSEDQRKDQRKDQREDLAFIMVFNRYGKGTKAAGVVRNFGLTQGAVATTVSHDSHNLVTVWKNANDGAMAVNALIEAGGGEVTCIDGKLALIELPVGGLMSDLPADQVAAKLETYQEHYYRAFGGAKVSLLRPATTSLIVSPEYKISDMGIVDVLKQKVIPLFPDQEV
jgi:adenine deaminase